MKITQIMGYKNLPDWCKSNYIREEDWASYLLIEDGDYRACYSDAMEPEDATFYRDLKWIKKELERASIHQQPASNGVIPQSITTTHDDE